MSFPLARELRAPGLRARIPYPVLVLLCACAAPERAPVTTASIASSVEERDFSAEALRVLVERAGLTPLALGPLPADGAALQLDAAPFWRACALAYSPGVRAARRARAAARARATSAGQPQDIWATLELEELDDPGARGRIMGTVDVLGILGLGRAATARELADAETRSARAGLEIAAWDALVAVDAARAGLAAARAEATALDELAAELASSARRTEVLARHGRLSQSALSAVRIAEHALAQRLAAVRAREADARAALATTAGLPADAPELDLVTPATLAPLVGEAATLELPARAALLERDPRLRAALVEHAVAEARLLDESAARWPSFRLGPHLLWRPDELLLGLVAATQIPWPGALDGRVRAAFEAREAAREAAEDLLVAEEARAVSAAVRRAELRAALEQHAAPAAEEATAFLIAARLRYDVEPQALEQIAHAITLRLQALERLNATRLGLVEAGLELRRVAGPELLAEDES